MAPASDAVKPPLPLRSLSTDDGSPTWTSPARSTRNAALAAQAKVNWLLDSVGVDLSPQASITQACWRGLDEATFADLRWENALRHLNSQGEGWAREVLRRGARSFGLWHISDLALESLVLQLQGEPKLSAALDDWLTRCTTHNSGHVVTRAARHSSNSSSSDADADAGMHVRGRASITAADVKQFKQAHPSAHRAGTKLKVLYTVVILAISFAIVVPKGPNKAVETFGWPIVVARMCGVAALLGTNVLFLTMSRTLGKVLYRLLPATRHCRFLDENVVIHAFMGKLVFVFGVVHACAHYFSTYQAFAYGELEALNDALKCSRPSKLDKALFDRVPYLKWPLCPLKRNYSFGETLAMTPGITGIALFAVLLLMARTAASRKDVVYERFWCVHNWGMLLWVLFLFFHGSEDWFGIGVPLVVPVCGGPLLCYLLDRVLRVVRYYAFKLEIHSVVIRPGKDGGPRNAMTSLEISKPHFLWSLQEGMYAYICVPEISPWEWHPFTICSCREDETVDFIVQGVGDWTMAFSQRCLDMRQGAKPPLVALDGPYAAPVTTALASRVLVAVGAGVGITPFLSLLSCIIAALGREEGRGRKLQLEEAHFFWIARSGDEFLFGRKHFTRIATRPEVRKRVFLHLHLTRPEQEGSAPAFLFREAVRRQSRQDRAAFNSATEELAGELLPRLSLPWGWLGGSALDATWLSGLVETGDEHEEGRLAEAHADHWANGYAAKRGRSGVFKSRTTSKISEADAVSHEEALVPVLFGRPDFVLELRAIGKARPEHDVNVYACGGTSLVESLREACKLCADRARAKAGGGRAQHYVFRHEHFGGT